MSTENLKIFKLLKAKTSRAAVPGWTIDLSLAATKECPRAMISRQITAWELAGLVEVKASQVRSVSSVSTTDAFKHVTAQFIFQSKLYSDFR